MTSKMEREDRDRVEKSLGNTIQHLLDRFRELFGADLFTLLLLRKVRSVTLSSPSGPEVSWMDSGKGSSLEPWLVSCDNDQVYDEVISCLESSGSKLLTPILAGRTIVTLSKVDSSWMGNHEASGKHPCRSLIFMPLLIEGDIFGGLLGIWTSSEHQFSSSEVKIADLLGSQTAMVFRTARLQKSLQSQVERLHGLLEVSSVIYSSLDYQVVLEKVINHAKNLVGADGCSIYTMDQEKQALIPLVTNDEKYKDQIMGLVLKLGEGLTGKVAQTGTGIISNYAEADNRTVHIPGTPDEPESLLSVPLMWSGAVIGVMTINAKGHKRFREEDLQLLTIFARLVADALENARLYENLEKAYKVLSQTQEQLVQTERLRALGEMAGGVAHDFNNILGSIMGRAQLLARDITDAKLQRHLELIQKSAQDGAEVVRRVQEFTRVHRGSRHVSLDVNQVLEDALEKSQSKWNEDSQDKAISVEIRKDLSAQGQIMGISQELTEVFSNIILNSLDSISVSGSISISSFEDKGRVYVRITDTGRGMTPEVRQRIFDPFFTTKGKPGTGLGLSVAYGIVARHKGEIEVESAIDKGTSVSINFPMSGKAEEAPAKSASQKVTRKLNIMVVDDDENIRGILSDILSLDGHQVQQAESGYKALEFYKPDKFDIVITDLGMPGLSGWEVARQIKTQSPNQPVVLISGWGGQIDPQKLKEYKIDFMVSKPFNIEQIRAILAQSLSIEKQPV